jgi:hypothetical protein
MNQKITRRVVLGTAIAGLTAGPFVIRALRQEKPLEPSESVFPVSYARKQLFQEWKDVHQTLSVKKEPMDSPKIVSVKHDFSKPRHWKFRALETHYIGEFDSPETAQPENIASYTLMEGIINVEGGEQGKLHVSINKHEINQMEIDIEASRKNGVNIVEKQMKNTDGTLSTHITVPADCHYDIKTKRFTTNVVEKKTIYPLLLGQFVLDKTLLFNYDEYNNINVISQHLREKFLLGQYYFCPLIRFPLPESPLEIGKNFECSVTEDDFVNFQIPLYQGRYQERVRCADFTTIKIVSEFTNYEKYLHKQDNAYRKKIKAQFSTDEFKFFEKTQNARIKEIEEKIKSSVPNFTYFIDSETGCIVRREECNTISD